MSTESHVMALLEAGNPATGVNDAAWSAMSAAEHLAVLEERGSTMTKLAKDPGERAARRRSIGWFAAAIVAVVLGIGVLFVSQRQSEVAQSPATTAAPTTVAPTTTAQPANLDTALDLVDAMYGADGEAMAALPWALPSAMEDIGWLSAYAAYVNAAVVDSSCETESNGVVCTVASIDDISRLIDPAAVYEDTITIRFAESTGLILSAEWQSEWNGGLDDFLNWTQTNGDGIYEAGAVCHLATQEPVACAQTLTELADRYVSTRDS